MMPNAHFTIAYWCLLIAAFLPIVCAGIAKSGMFNTPRRDGGYDNHDPRAWLARQTDWRARANAAQANTFEALPFFFAAVTIAHTLSASQTMVDVLCFLWLLLRSLYIITYLGDMATARSGVWTGALVVNVAILLVGYK
jgi:uncharacterized MAPEG superfamily protein